MITSASLKRTVKVAALTITRLIVQIKGAFVADSKSAQLKNGKIQGYMVVRMPRDRSVQVSPPSWLTETPPSFPE